MEIPKSPKPNIVGRWLQAIDSLTWPPRAARIGEIASVNPRPLSLPNEMGKTKAPKLAICH